MELMLVIGLAAVLASAAVPSFTSAIQNSRLVTHYNALSASLTLARSEAIKRASNVSVCALETNTACATGTNGDWNQGWIVFDDSGENRGVIDADEEIIRRVKLDDTELVMENSSQLNPGVSTPVARDFIRFSPRGTSNWRGAGYFLLCIRGTGQARLANITLSGDVRRGRKDASDDLITVFGNAATCP